MYKEFRFVKDYTCDFGTVKEGTTLIVSGNSIIMDGYPIQPGFYNIFKDLVNSELKQFNYLRESIVTTPKNEYL